MADTKVCSNQDCEMAGIPQPRSNFALRKRGEDAVHSMCKPCNQAYQRERAKKIKDSGKVYQSQSADNKAAHLPYELLESWPVLKLYRILTQQRLGQQ